MRTAAHYTQSLAERVEKEKAAAALTKAVSDLFYDQGVEIVLFRQTLLDLKPSEILSAHAHAAVMTGAPIQVEESVFMAEAMSSMHLAPSRIDIGRLAVEWKREGAAHLQRERFLAAKLAGFTKPNHTHEPVDVVLYGFGRIGRLVARELLAQEGKGEQLRLRAIVARGSDALSVEKRASLLRVDSVHGAFPGTVEADVENQALVVNGRPIHLISASSPEEIDYTAYGIHNALVIDNTGAFRDETALRRHLTSKGAAKVLLTAPGKGVPNVVMGVNESMVTPELGILSAASCTTNAIVPVLKVMNDQFGIEKGHIETIHAYTNDQNLVDNMHPKYRRGRAAALNMVITETGAGSAVDKALPGLGSKLTSNAIRVPVPNGSLAILNLTLSKNANREAVNAALKAAAYNGPLVEQIMYSVSPELVSSDIVGNPCPSIVDSEATIVHTDDRSVVLYVWYDNEYGYTRQVLRLAKYYAGVESLKYY
jgi:glyceraldehyde 3-phosphate dehydrogenase